MIRRPDVLHGKTSRRRLTKVGMAVAVATCLAVQMVTAQGAADQTGVIGPMVRRSVVLPGDVQAVDSLKGGEQSARAAGPRKEHGKEHSRLVLHNVDW